LIPEFHTWIGCKTAELVASWRAYGQAKDGKVPDSMRFQRQLGGLKLWEIRSHGTSWIHLLSSSSNCSKLWPLVRLFNARSPRKSTKRQSKVGQQINHERMEAESFFFFNFIFELVKAVESPRNN